MIRKPISVRQDKIYWVRSAPRHELTLIDKLHTTEWWAVNSILVRQRRRSIDGNEWTNTFQQWNHSNFVCGNGWKEFDHRLCRSTHMLMWCVCVSVSLSRIVMACNVIVYLTGKRQLLNWPLSRETRNERAFIWMMANLIENCLSSPLGNT